MTDKNFMRVEDMGKAKNREMLFWTQEEYKKFAEVMMDKPISFYAFEMLYWCGIREGELLALTPADFDFEKQTVSITKSYQRIKGQDLITEPKTPKSNRVVKMPDFLSAEIQDFIGQEKAIKEKRISFCQGRFSDTQQQRFYCGECRPLQN